MLKMLMFMFLQLWKLEPDLGLLIFRLALSPIVGKAESLVGLPVCELR